MKITLRPVADSDAPFLFELYASTRAFELAQVPWTDSQKHTFLQMQFTAQKSSYAKEYPHAQHDLIYLNDEAVGRLYLARGQNCFHILDITIADRYKNKGIGSAVLRKILQEANQADKPTTIYVENFNPSIRLFERLGFRVSSARGFIVLLERQPAPLN